MKQGPALKLPSFWSVKKQAWGFLTAVAGSRCGNGPAGPGRGLGTDSKIPDIGPPANQGCPVAARPQHLGLQPISGAPSTLTNLRQTLTAEPPEAGSPGLFEPEH